LPVLLSAGVVVLLATGCGGGGESVSVVLTKAEWIDRVDAVCAEANAEIRELGEPENAEELASLAEQAARINEEALDTWRALQAPPDVEELAARATEITQEEIDVLQEISSAAADRDQQRVERLLAEIEPLDEEAAEIAHAIGLQVCGQDR
jgi:hypothetical protein